MLRKMIFELELFEKTGSRKIRFTAICHLREEEFRGE